MVCLFKRHISIDSYRDGDAELLEDEESGSATEPSAASSSVYSLIESAHPVFGRVKRLWNSPLESHREVCAVLAAISEVYMYVHWVLPI